MIFEYFGKIKSQEELSKRLGANSDVWVSNEELEIVAQENGFYTQSATNATLEDLKAFVDQGIPTIINYIDPDNHEGHFAIVTDYTDTFLVLNDPWYGNYFALPLEYIAQNWRSFDGNRPQWLLAISNGKFGN